MVKASSDAHMREKFAGYVPLQVKHRRKMRATLLMRAKRIKSWQREIMKLRKRVSDEQAFYDQSVEVYQRMYKVHPERDTD